eukprot:jgi/Ulvmu1/12397/UM009_0044.1
MAVPRGPTPSGLSVSRSMQDVEDALVTYRKELNIDDAVHQAIIKEVARDPEVQALQAGQLPPPSVQAPTLVAQLTQASMPFVPANGGVMPMPPQMMQHAKQRMPHSAARRQVKPAPGVHVAHMAPQPPIQTGAAPGMFPAVMAHSPQHVMPQQRILAHPSMAANSSPPPGYAPVAPPGSGGGGGRGAVPAVGAPGSSAAVAAGHLHAAPAARGAYAKRSSDDTTSSTGAPSGHGGGGGGGGGKGGKKGKQSRQRALEQACPAVLRHRINESELQGLVIERHWEREGWCRGIIAHSVERKSGSGTGFAYHIIYDLDSTTVRPSWELSVTLSILQAGEKWRIPNPPMWITRNWKDIVPPASSKKTARKGADAQRPAAAASAKPVSTLHPGITFGSSAKAGAPAATAAAAALPPAAAARPPPPARPSAPARNGSMKRPPPAAGGVRPAAAGGSAPRAVADDELYAACREAESTGNNSAVLQLLEAVRARRSFLCDRMARHRLSLLIGSAGLSGARKRLEKALLENRAKQRKIDAELKSPTK